MLNKFLKLLGFVNCWICNKKIHKSRAFVRHFVDSPDEYGYPAPLCEGCDSWCEEHQRG